MRIEQSVSATIIIKNVSSNRSGISTQGKYETVIYSLGNRSLTFIQPENDEDDEEEELRGVTRATRN